MTPPITLLQVALDYIAQKQRDLEAQINHLDQADDRRVELLRQLNWLKNQAQQLKTESSADRRLRA